jgi:hypothetical protein
MSGHHAIGFAPRSILSTKSAARPDMCGQFDSTSRFDVRAHRRRHVRGERQSIDANAIDQCDRSGRDVERLRSALECLESRIDVFSASQFERVDLNAEPGSCLPKLVQLYK